MSIKPRKRAGRRKTISENGWHGGWQVHGVPPQAEQLARVAYESGRGADRADKPWDPVTWLRNAKLCKAAPPFGTRAAAQHCVEVAERAGWRRLQVTELKSEGSGSTGKDLAGLT